VVEQVVDVAGARGRVLLRQRPVGVGGADDPVPAGALAVAAAQFSVRAIGPDAEKAVETVIGILSAVSKVGD